MPCRVLVHERDETSSHPSKEIKMWINGELYPMIWKRGQLTIATLQLQQLVVAGTSIVKDFYKARSHLGCNQDWETGIASVGDFSALLNLWLVTSNIMQHVPHDIETGKSWLCYPFNFYTIFPLEAWCGCGQGFEFRDKARVGEHVFQRRTRRT